MSRKSKTPRKADTYRGARRTQAKKAGLLDEWKKKAVIRSKVRPYQPEPPKFKVVKLPDGKFSMVSVPRKQPKQYKPNGKREQERRMRHLYEAEARTVAEGYWAGIRAA